MGSFWGNAILTHLCSAWAPRRPVSMASGKVSCCPSRDDKDIKLLTSPSQKPRPRTATRDWDKYVIRQSYFPFPPAPPLPLGLGKVAQTEGRKMPIQWVASPWVKSQLNLRCGCGSRASTGKAKEKMKGLEQAHHPLRLPNIVGEQPYMPRRGNG